MGALKHGRILSNFSCSRSSCVRPCRRSRGIRRTLFSVNVVVVTGATGVKTVTPGTWLLFVTVHLFTPVRFTSKPANPANQQATKLLTRKKIERGPLRTCRVHRRQLHRGYPMRRKYPRAMLCALSFSVLELRGWEPTFKIKTKRGVFMFARSST